MLAGLAMAMSSVTVVGNSILHERYKRRFTNAEPPNREEIYIDEDLDKAFNQCEYLHYLHRNLFRAQNYRKSVEVLSYLIFCTSTLITNLHEYDLHEYDHEIPMVDIPKLKVEILLLDTSTNRSPNQAPFDNISKSGDGGDSGGSFPIYWRSGFLIPSYSICFIDLVVSHRWASIA